MRRENRIRTIHASLAIENNTLTLEQVTAVINGRPVLGSPREIQEVRNALAAYEAMEGWKVASLEGLLTAHRLLMNALVNDTGRFRSSGVGVFRGDQPVHMAPPAGRIPQLMGDLLSWLKHTDEHPLVAGCVFHYELEFIHPFADGNGRMARLWQTLILRDWKPFLAWLPVETVVRDRQDDYYRVPAEADKLGEATPFVEFMLQAWRDKIEKSMATDQVTGQVARTIQALATGELGRGYLQGERGTVMNDLLLSENSGDLSVVPVSFWDIGVFGRVSPSDPLPSMPVMEDGSLLVIGGHAPIWRYGLAFRAAFRVSVAAVAAFDPSLGAVVVASHSPLFSNGQIVKVDWPSYRTGLE